MEKVLEVLEVVEVVEWGWGVFGLRLGNYILRAHKNVVKVSSYGREKSIKSISG